MHADVILPIAWSLIPGLSPVSSKGGKCLETSLAYPTYEVVVLHILALSHTLGNVGVIIPPHTHILSLSLSLSLSRSLSRSLSSSLPPPPPPQRMCRLVQLPSQLRLASCLRLMAGEWWSATAVERQRTPSSLTLWWVCVRDRSRLVPLAALNDWPSTTSCCESKKSLETRQSLLGQNFATQLPEKH